MAKFVKNKSKTSKFALLEGLICFETDKQYYVVWFKLNNPKNLRKYEIYIKERPFLSSRINKECVKIIPRSELTIPNPLLAINMAYVQATHLTGGAFRPRTLPERWQRGETKNFYKDIDSRLLIYI